LVAPSVVTPGDYSDLVGVAFLGQNAMQRVKPKQQPFFTNFKAWYSYANFVTKAFPKFLGFFVQSGIYELAM